MVWTPSLVKVGEEPPLELPGADVIVLEGLELVVEPGIGVLELESEDELEGLATELELGAELEEPDGLGAELELGTELELEAELEGIALELELGAELEELTNKLEGLTVAEEPLNTELELGEDQVEGAEEEAEEDACEEPNGQFCAFVLLHCNG